MEAKIRFGVRSDDGRTSNVWTCWTQPQKGDAYLTSDVLGKAMKLCDHPSGRSHLAYHREKGDELFTPETRPKERFILKQEDADRTEEVWRLIACVFVPAGSPHDVPREAPADTVWLPEAPAGQATEVGIFRMNLPPTPGTWPGMQEGATLLADLPLGGLAHLGIVWRHSAFQMPPIPANPPAPKMFRGRTDDDVLEANRMVIFGTTSSGAYSLIETPVTIRRNAEGQ